MNGQPSKAAAEPVPVEALVLGRVRSSRRIRAEHVRDYGIIAFVIGIFAFFSIASPVFLTTGNLLNLVYQNATVGIVACAVTLVIIAGNFDLSLGAIFALSEVLCAWSAVHLGIAWAFPVAIVAGAAMGLVNGLLVTKLRVNSFLATLSSGLAFSGIAVGVTGGVLITVSGDAFTFIGQERAGDIQYPNFIFLVVAVVLQLVLAFTVFGRYCYGVGGNRDAARLSGIKVDSIVIVTFVITGAACGASGLIDASTAGAGSSAVGTNLALSAIAAVALGGTSIFGGIGSVWRTVVGVFMLGMITNGFNLLSVPNYWQDIVRGGLIVVAVAIGTLVERRS